MGEKKRNQGAEIENKNPFELVVFVIGLLITLGVLGYLTYLTIKRDNSLPDLYTHHIVEEPRPGQFLLHIYIHNKGGITAENVRIKTTIQYSSGTEEADYEFHFVPSKSKNEVYLPLKEKIAEKSVSVKVMKFTVP